MWVNHLWKHRLLPDCNYRGSSAAGTWRTARGLAFISIQKTSPQTPRRAAPRHCQLLSNSPGLSPVSALGGERLLISWTSFRSTRLLRKAANVWTTWCHSSAQVKSTCEQQVLTLNLTACTRDCHRGHILRVCGLYVFISESGQKAWMLCSRKDLLLTSRWIVKFYSCKHGDNKICWSLK